MDEKGHWADAQRAVPKIGSFRYGGKLLWVAGERFCGAAWRLCSITAEAASLAFWALLGSGGCEAMHGREGSSEDINSAHFCRMRLRKIISDREDLFSERMRRIGHEDLVQLVKPCIDPKSCGSNGFVRPRQSYA